MAKVHRSYFATNNIRPKLRGKVHQYAFYLTLVLATILFYYSPDWRTHLILCFYSTPLLILYSVSGYYHQQIWLKKHTERIIQKMDHASIYLVIGGTYTGLLLITLPLTEREWSEKIVVLMWILALLGVLKTFLCRETSAAFDVAIFISMGWLTMLPYFPHLYTIVQSRDIVCCLMGGVFYSMGGITYARRSPNPLPDLFGYHEIFHVCTVFAQIALWLPVYWSLVDSYQASTTTATTTAAAFVATSAARL